jgi:hypothetical protein
MKKEKGGRRIEKGRRKRRKVSEEGWKKEKGRRRKRVGKGRRERRKEGGRGVEE